MGILAAIQPGCQSIPSYAFFEDIPFEEPTRTRANGALLTADLVNGVRLSGTEVSASGAMKTKNRYSIAVAKHAKALSGYRGVAVSDGGGTGIQSSNTYAGIAYSMQGGDSFGGNHSIAVSNAGRASAYKGGIAISRRARAAAVLE